jgi:hypothetical protein
MKAPKNLKIVCGWCGILIKNGDTYPGGEVSTGICKECAKKVEKEIEKMKRRKR